MDRTMRDKVAWARRKAKERNASDSDQWRRIQTKVQREKEAEERRLKAERDKMTEDLKEVALF